jgi:hypothetical protein
MAVNVHRVLDVSKLCEICGRGVSFRNRKEPR